MGQKVNLRELIVKYNLFTPILSELVKSLLISENIKFHVVENRTKDIQSLENKLLRKKISDIEHVTDITGIRIILYYQDDIDRVNDLLRSNFHIDEPNSIDKSEILESNEFGYLSVHYIVQLDKKRNKLPEWKNYSKLKAEIQVRTVLQHSWASISHELSYKRNIEIPKSLNRKLYRLAGLFELADEEFMEIRDKHFELKNKIEKLSESDKLLKEDINSLTLREAMYNEDSVFKQIEGIAFKAGFTESEEPDTSIPNIIFISKLLDLKNIGDIETILISNLDSIRNLFKELLKRSKGEWMGDLSWFVELSLLLVTNKEQRNSFWDLVKRQYASDIWETVEASIEETKKTVANNGS